MASFYPAVEGLLSPKCQCVTFEKSGKILGSCDSLFSVSGLSPEAVNRSFPFLSAIADTLARQGSDGEPEFYPGLDFSFGRYRSICDFTFMKSTDAHGKEHYIWMIYDNSMHYRLLISEPEKPEKSVRKPAAHTITSATFFRAG